MTDTPPALTLSVKEAAKMLKVHPITVYDLIGAARSPPPRSVVPT